MSDLFLPKGRMSSRDYFAVSIAMIALFLGFIYCIWQSKNSQVTFLLGLGCLPLLYLIIIFTIKRLHDVDLSGWWSIFVIIAPLNFAFIPYLWFKTGDKGSNQYGKNPYTFE